MTHPPVERDEEGGPGASSVAGRLAQDHAGEIAELLDLAPVGALVRSLDADVITYWSRGAEQLYGWSVAEAVGQVSHTLLQTVFPISQAEMLQSLIATGQWSGELVHTTRGGQRLVVASRMVVRNDDQGRPLSTLELNTDLSLHKSLQSDLRASDERFRVLVEAVRDYAIILLSPDGTVLTWNDGAQRLKGFLPNEIIGESFTRFYPPEDLEQRLPHVLLQRAAAEGRTEHEGWRVRKDGSRFWANVVLTALRDSDGQLTGFAKITRDLTERKQAEEARARASLEEGSRAGTEAAAAQVRASRDQLAAILAAVADGITVLDQSGRMQFANDAAARLCGFAHAAELVAAEPQEILARFEVLDESGGRLAPEHLPSRRALMGETPPPTPVRFRIRATGEERWSMVSATPIRNDDGGVVMAVSVFQDATEQKRAEDTARFMAAVNLELTRTLDYRETLRRVAQLAIPTLADWCVVDVLDDRGELQRLAVAHVDPAKVELAQTVQERYPADPNAAQGVHAVLRSGRPQLLAYITADEVEASAQDANHAWMLNQLQLRSAITVPMIARERSLGAITLVTAESGRHYSQADVIVAKDLAVRAALAVDNARLFQEAQEQAATHAELNQALRRAMDQLERELHTRDEFLAAASHDLKNPVATIKATAQLLLRRLRRGHGLTTDDFREAFERIESVATRAGVQVDEMLDDTRTQMGQLLDLERRPTDLAEFAVTLALEHQQQTDRHEVRVERGVPALWVSIDERRMARAIGNLLDNAVKYSPDGGMIRIELAADHQTQTAVIAVHDQGVGIPTGDIERVFDRFERGSNVVGVIAGTGIGLASARRIVESHGGTLQARSEPGRGTSFVIRLPMTTGAGSEA